MPRLVAIAFTLLVAVLLMGPGEGSPLAGFPGADGALLVAGEAPAPDLPEHDGDASELEMSSSEVGATDPGRDGRVLDTGVAIAWPEGVMPGSLIHPPVLRPPIA